MESSARSSYVRCIGDEGDGTDQYHECNNLNVWLNCQGETLLYTGKLLLIKDESKNATRSTPPQWLLRRAGNRSTPPKQDQNASACSKIFSALEVADNQFNSSSTTTTSTTITTTTTAAEGATTTTTDSSASATSSFAKTSAKSTSLPLKMFTTASSKMSNNASFWANGAGESSSIDSPFVATKTKQNRPKSTAAQPVTSSGIPKTPWNTTGSQENQECPSLFGFSEKLARPKAIAKKGPRNTVGACKLPFPSSREDHLNGISDREKKGRKIATTMKKGKSDEKDEDVDSSGCEEKRKGSKEGSSNSLPKELLNAQLRCFQIQHSLYRVLVAKLCSKESESELEASSQLPRDTESDDLQSLLLPLETLLRCSDIQLGLHHSLNVALDSETGRRQDVGEGQGYSYQENVGRMIYDKDELLIESRSLMNHTKFAQSLVCLHLSNPYSSNLKYAAGEDRIFSFESLFWTSNYYVPHGEGKLVSLDGHLIYEGQWKKGKRWGHGKAFIFSGTELSASKKQYGVYEGQWWNNMRHGHGRLVFASCSVYEGEWQYDLMSGVGAMHSPDGSVLEGLWDEDEPSGCGMFTWPSGAVEYREYQNGQVVKVLESKEETKKISPLNEVMREYSVLRLKYQMLEEDKARLMQSELRMKEQQTKSENFKQANQAKVKQLRGRFTELLRKHKKNDLEKYREELQEMNERHDKKIKDLEDKIHQIEAELEGKKSDLLCQICFERYRNCILMPCSHLLYCQTCISKLHADSKPARCPVCRGTINSQINCNLNQLK